MQIEYFPDIAGDRRVGLVFVQTLADLVAIPKLATAHFVLVLAADARGSSDTALHQFTTDLVTKGVSYACCWGPDCERMELSFDWADITINDPGDDVIITTSHPDEAWREAIWFGVTVAFPTDRYAAETGSVVIAIVGNDSWAAQAREYLKEEVPMRDEA